MVVLAERYKKIFKYLLLWGAIVLALSIVMFAHEGCNGWNITGIVLGVCLVLGSGYGCLLPKEAIVRNGDKLMICYLFKTKIRSVSHLKYASHHEIGTWVRNDDSLVEWLTWKNDVRRITLTFEQNGETEQIAVTVEQAEAVAVALNGLVKKEK